LAKVTTGAAPQGDEGTILHIGPAADTRTRSFTTKITVSNPERRLLPGMIASVTVNEALEDGKVIIPQSWLITKMDGIGVFLAKDNTAVWRPVKTGSVVHEQVVIEEGLSVDDMVVSTGHRGLADGDALIVTREGTCCKNGRAVFAAAQPND